MSLTSGSPGHGWSWGPVALGLGWRMRRHGLRALPPPWGLLLRTSCVHGFGLHVEAWAAALDEEGRVQDVLRLRRGRALHFPGAAWVLELPEPATPPPLGEVLRARPIVSRCPGS